MFGLEEVTEERFETFNAQQAFTLGGRFMDDRYTTHSMQGLSDGAYSSFQSTS